MLTSIPIISPIDVTLGQVGVLRLPAPDYEIHALPPAADLAVTPTPHDSAQVALDEMDRAAQIGEYHDFSWWDERIRLIRSRLELNRDS